MVEEALPPRDMDESPQAIFTTRELNQFRLISVEMNVDFSPEYIVPTGYTDQ